jgi:hypothetical protein
MFLTDRRITKAHIDFLMMAILQYALAAALTEIPRHIVQTFVIGKLHDSAELYHQMLMT